MHRRLSAPVVCTPLTGRSLSDRCDEGLERSRIPRATRVSPRCALIIDHFSEPTPPAQARSLGRSLRVCRSLDGVRGALGHPNLDFEGRARQWTGSGVAGCHGPSSGWVKPSGPARIGPGQPAVHTCPLSVLRSFGVFVERPASRSAQPCLDAPAERLFIQESASSKRQRQPRVRNALASYRRGRLRAKSRSIQRAADRVGGGADSRHA
jgi:hypothetical protein